MAINESEDSTPPGMEQAQIVPGYRRRVIVKFKDHVQLPREDTARAMESMGVGPWNALTAQFEGITLEPLLSFKPEQFAALTERARALDSSFRATNLGAYFAVNLPPGMDAEAVVKALSEWESVATAYVEPPPVEPPFVNAADDPRSGNQGYLDPAPDGIDAEYAWNFPGGDGAGQALVDMEWGWTFNHEDLAAHGITLISGLNHSYYFHGSARAGRNRGGRQCSWLCRHHARAGFHPLRRSASTGRRIQHGPTNTRCDCGHGIRRRAAARSANQSVRL